MTTLTLSPDTETGSITLDILKTADVAKVIRTNVNGSEEVRVSAGQLPSAPLSALVRTNLMPNPSVETNLTGYVAPSVTPERGNPTQTRVTSGGLFGSAHLRLTTTVDATAPNYFICTTVLPALTGGKTYVASAYIRCSDPTANLWVLSGGGMLNPTTLATETLGGWTRKSLRFTALGTGTVYPNINIGASGPAILAGTTIDVDAVLVEEATTLSSYFDGDTADVSGFDYAWTGTAHASTSTLNTVGGRLILTDYEASQGLNSYNVYAADGSFVTGSADLEIDKPWLSVPVMPQYSEQIETVTAYGASREAATTVHRPLGRADSLVVMGKLGDRTGSLEVWCSSYADARRLERIFERGEIVQLRQRVEGLDMYFTVTGIPVSPYSVQGEDATRWSLTLTYIEVRRPIGNLSGALGWTFDELATEFASFDAVTLAFTDFDSLTLGDGIV